MSHDKVLPSPDITLWIFSLSHTLEATFTNTAGLSGSYGEVRMKIPLNDSLEKPWLIYWKEFKILR